MKRIVHVLLVLAFVFFASTAFSKNDNLPQGRPFQMLDSKIDQIYQELAEDIGELFQTTQNHEERIAVCESQIATLQAENEQLVILIENNAKDIAALEDRVITNEDKITILQNYIDTLSAALYPGCPEGSAIRSYTPSGGIVCEDDNSGAENVSFVTVTEIVDYEVLNGLTYKGIAECPADGYSVTGGGYADLGAFLLGTAALLSHTHKSAPFGNSWAVHIEADILHTFQVYVRCLKIE